MLLCSFCRAFGTAQLTGWVISLMWALGGENRHSRCSEAIKAGLRTTLQSHCAHCPYGKQLKGVIPVQAGSQKHGSVQSDSPREEGLQGEEMTVAYRHQQCNLSVLTWGEDVKCSRIPISGSPALWFDTAIHFWIILIRWSQNNVTFPRGFCNLLLVLWPMFNSMDYGSQPDEWLGML